MGNCTSRRAADEVVNKDGEAPEVMKGSETDSTVSLEASNPAGSRGASKGHGELPAVSESGRNDSNEASRQMAEGESALGKPKLSDNDIPLALGLSSRPLPGVPVIPFELKCTEKGMLKIEPTRKFAAFCLPPELAPKQSGMSMQVSVNVNEPSGIPVPEHVRRAATSPVAGNARMVSTSPRGPATMGRQASRKYNYLRNTLKRLSLMDLNAAMQAEAAAAGTTATASAVDSMVSSMKSSSEETPECRNTPNKSHLLRVNSVKDLKQCTTCGECQIRGVSCMCSHFLCTECFCDRVREVCTEPELLRKHDFAVFCPVKGCTSHPWNSYHVRKLLDGPTLQLYLDTLVNTCRAGGLYPSAGGNGTGNGNYVRTVIYQGPGGADPYTGSLSGNLRYIVQTAEVLREQLRKLGVVPSEYLPLQEIQDELQAIFTKLNNNEPYDEKRMDYLLMCMELNPVYRAEKEELARQWREEMSKFTSECLATMRGYVPAHISEASLQSLQEVDGINLDLAKRLLTKKCLWLVRMRVVDIERIHEVDLIGRFNPIAQGLDIVELAAIFACVPEKFVNDPTGKKNQWRLNLENALREMDKQRQEGKLPASKARNPCYKKQVIAPFMHRKTMRINEVVLSGLAYDQEFSSKSHVMEQ